MLKKSISIILTVTLLMSIIIVTPFSSNAAEVGSNEDASGVSNDMSVVGTNSFGQMLSSEIGDKQAEQEGNDNCVISVEMEGNTATVEYQASQDATLVVAIYSDDETQMLASGQIDVSNEEDNAQLTIDIETMPQFFYLKAYLIDKECYRPICTVYESSLYTQEMQEFLAKTTDDFVTEKVLNLDEDKDNNFAVFNNDVEIIEQVAGINEVVSADEDSKTYTIKNADENIASLQAGDIFTYAYDDTVLIIKVKSISVEGKTAVIQGDEMDLEEAFDYIKIDTLSNVEDSDYDDSELSDCLNCEGEEPYSEIDYSEQPNGAKLYSSKKDLEPVGAEEQEVSFSSSVKYTFDEYKQETDSDFISVKASIKGSANLTFKATLKYYLSLTRFYTEFKLKTSITFSGSISMNGELKIPLGHYGIRPVPGIYIGFSPAIVLECNINIELSLTVENTIGFRVSSDKGFENISKMDDVKIKLKGELTIFFGLSLKPEVKILGSVVKATVEAKGGGEIKIGKSIGNSEIQDILKGDNVHNCSVCFEGEIFGKLVLSFEVKILDNDNWAFKKSIEFKTKISDFYWSLSHGDLGFRKCPHRSYLVTVNVIDSAGLPIKDAVVNSEYTTNQQGVTKLFLPNGINTISVTSPLGNKTELLPVEDEPNSILVELDCFAGAAGNISQICVGYQNGMALTKDGDIYLWGRFPNNCSWTEPYNDSSFAYRNSVIKTPAKFNLSLAGISPNSVKQIACGYNHCVALLKDGRVYTWGHNEGYLGNGKTSDTGIPQLVLDNVKMIKAKYHTTLALTNNGDVYVWGSILSSNRIFKTQSTPLKIMDGVSSIGCGDTNCLMIKSGSLYIYGLVNQEYYYQPTKIRENVRYADSNHHNVAVIQNDGSLYMKGNNSDGQLGIGNTQQIDGFVFTASDISSVSLGTPGTDTCAAISNKGILYTWGEGLAGNELGDGKSYSHIVTTPQAILTNVVSVARGWQYTAYLTTEGKIYCFGLSSEQIDKLNAYSLGDYYYPQPYYHVECVLTRNTHSTFSSQKAFASVGAGEDDETEDPEIKPNSPAVKTMSFSNLKPSEVYNVYSVADKTEDYLISQQNLKYINQVVTDENGSISLDYIPTEAVENSFVFAVPLEQTDISETRIVESEYTYNGEEQYYVPLILNGDDLLEFGKDYIITGQPYATAPGEYVVKIVGKGLCKGAVSKTFVISSANINEASISLASGYPTYDGTAKEPALSITYRGLDLTENVDYTVTYRNNINAGTAYADVEGIGGYLGRKTSSFSIQPIHLDESCISPNVIDYQLYNRESLIPDIKVVYNGKELVKGTDYEIDCYSDEIYGYVDVYAFGKGNYSGWMRLNIRGDIDQDSRVTGRDLVLLQKYLNSTPEERDGLWLSVEAADVNADGVVNDSDVTALREFLKSHRVTDDIRPENAESDSNIKKLSISPDEASVGETISIPITIDNNQGFSYLRMSFNYDDSKLTFLNAENGEVTNSIFSNNKNIVFWNDDDDIGENGRLVTLKFKVLEVADGYNIQYKCSECYNSIRNYIEAELSNDTVDVIDPSTCNHIDEDNNDICDICGASLNIFVGHSISLNGDIGVNFYVNVPDEDVDNGKVKVNFAWKVDNKEKTYSVTLSSNDKTDNGYKASCPIAVAEMTYDITATVTIEGVAQGKADTYSAKKYAKVILNNENSFREKYIASENGQGRNGEQRYNDLVTLVKTMLDYGTKAQIVFDRDTEHPANEGTDYFSDETYPVSADMITVTEENMDMDLSAYGLRYKGSTVVYLSETSIRHYYYVDDWESFNEIKDSVIFDGATVSYTEKDGAIYFEKKGVSASNLDTPYTLTIKDKSCKYAVNDYIRRCLESDKVTDNTKALVRATYRYNVAANAFFEV